MKLSQKVLLYGVVMLITAVFSVVAYKMGGSYEIIYTQLHNNDL